MATVAILNTPERGSAPVLPSVLSPIADNLQARSQLPATRTDRDAVFAMPEKRSTSSTARRLFTSTPVSASASASQRDSLIALLPARSDRARHSDGSRHRSATSSRSRTAARSLPSPRSSNAPTSLDDGEADGDTDADASDAEGDAWRETLAFASDKNVPLGPTPQRDGRIVGLFASLDEPASPTAKYLQSPTSIRARPLSARDGAAAEASPSKKRKLAAARDSTAVAAAKAAQNSLETPDCLRTRSFTFDDAAAGDAVGASTAMTEAPAARRRLFASSTMTSTATISTTTTLITATTTSTADAAEQINARCHRTGRHFRPPRALSQIIRDLRALEDDVTEDADALDALRELEAGVVPVALAPAELRDVIDTPDADGGASAAATTTTKPWKKKGLKRQTRRVKLKPTTAAQQEQARERERERNLQRELEQDRAEEAGEAVAEQEIPSDAEPNEDEAEATGIVPRSAEQGTSAAAAGSKSKTGAKHKQKPAVASSNFRSLKLRNSGHGGGRRMPARFRSKR